MKIWKLALAVALAGAGLAASAPPDKDARPSVLQPTGTWRVKYSQNLCILSHQFGSGQAQVTFALRPLPLGEMDDLLVLSRSSRVQSDSGLGTVTLQPGGKAIDSHYESVAISRESLRLTTMKVDHEETADLAASALISLKAGNDLDATIAPPNMKAALAALQTCQDDLLRSWSVDPALQSKIAVPAKGNPGRSVTRGDYPKAAYEKGEQGKATAIYQVGLDGKVHNCRIVISSHSDSLDDATCRALSRTQFTPALDKNGQPMNSTESVSVIWALP